MAQLKKILLVVDDEDLRKALTEQLMLSKDLKVSEGTNGAQAMEKLNQQSFDLIILDVGFKCMGCNAGIISPNLMQQSIALNDAFPSVIEKS